MFADAGPHKRRSPGGVANPRCAVARVAVDFALSARSRAPISVCTPDNHKDDTLIACTSDEYFLVLGRLSNLHRRLRLLICKTAVSDSVNGRSARSTACKAFENNPSSKLHRLSPGPGHGGYVIKQELQFTTVCFLCSG